MTNQTLSDFLTAPSKRNLAEDVTVRLRQAILSGQLSPNEPLRETALARLMGVSRGPIRVALARLEAEGLVIAGPTRRTRVARLSLPDLEEVYSLRVIFE